MIHDRDTATEPVPDPAGRAGNGATGETGGDPRVTIVVMTWNRPDELSRTLDRLETLPERPPVIAIDNGSDRPPARTEVERRDDWRLILLPENRGAVARNIGVAASTTPYVAFNDDDTWWEAGALSRAAAILDHHDRVAVLNARIVNGSSRADDPIVEELRNTPLESRGNLPGFRLGSFLAGASMVRRDAFLSVGGFEPRLLIGGEEELLATDLRTAGWELVHIPEVVVHHDASPVRDAHLRRRQGLRNHLWFLWLRRPAPRALQRSVDLLRRSPKDRHTAAAVIAAARGIPWVLRHRRVVSPEVEADQLLLDAQQSRSNARRYIS